MDDKDKKEKKAPETVTVALPIPHAVVSAVAESLGLTPSQARAEVVTRALTDLGMERGLTADEAHDYVAQTVIAAQDARRAAMKNPIERTVAKR